MPIIQLDFNNPLNTSVQVGDTVYFSNPSAVPTSGPNSTHVHGVDAPPHDTSSKEEIIKIGEIIPNGITPFDGTKSSIQCNMDQTLFNKYAGQIKAQCMVNPATVINVNADPDLINRITNFTPTGITSANTRPFHTILPDHSNKTKNTDLVADPPTNPSQPYPFANQNPSSYDIKMVQNFTMNQSFQSGNYDKWFGETSDDWLWISPAATLTAPGYSWHLNTPAFMPPPLNVWAEDSGIPLWPSGIKHLWTGPSSPNLTCGVSNANQTGGIACNYAWVSNDWVGVNENAINTSNREVTYTPNQIIQYLIDKGASGISLNTSSWDDVEAAANAIDYLFSFHGIYAFASYPIKTCNNIGSFIMFSKDNKVNQLDVLGYYAAVEYKNNSTEEAELFNVGTTYFNSSK